jgi:hypothetical protein
MNTLLKHCYTLVSHIVILSIIFSCALFAQISDKVLSVNAGTAAESQPLTISAQLSNTARVNQVLLAYRTFGSGEFRQLEASLMGSTASATIGGTEIVPGEIEYYFILKIAGKDSVETHTYPELNPETNPLRVQVEGTGSGGNKAALFLSPDPGTSSRTEDLLVSISLMNADTTVDKKATKLFIDDHDVTKYAIISEDLITLVPENVEPPLQDGPHSVRVELYKADGSESYKSTQSFVQMSAAAAEKAPAEFKYSISGEAEARNENLQNVSTPYNRGGLDVTSEYGLLQMNGHLYLTNEDKDNTQPQNRYLVEAKTPWLKASYGDAYPIFPNLILNGKRVRGGTANLSLGFFNVDFASGEIVRKVEGDTLRTFSKDSTYSVTYGNPSGAYAPYDTANNHTIWAQYRYGTYQRKLTAIRPSFGSANGFQWGFSYLKSTDETNSIQYGIKPQENVVVGTDMTIAADNRNFLITAQAAASAINKDISRGTLTDEQIDSLYNNDADSAKNRDDLKKIRDMIKPYITANENLVPLSVDKISSIMAGDAAMSLNYFNNYLKAGYTFRGSQYASFGQTYLRNDIKGINVYDRIRLAQNQLFVSASIEKLQDNLDQSKIATTDFSNFNTTVSYFPRMNFPNITIGYGRNSSSNSLNGILIDTTGQAADSVKREQVTQDSTKLRNAIEDVTTQFYVQLGYDFTMSGYRQNLSLSVSTSSRDDKTLQQLNTQSTTLSLLLSTAWQAPLQTSIGITENMNKNPLPTGSYTPATLVDYKYTTLLLSARYSLMESKLHLGAMFGPTFGDYKRTLWNANADYLLMKSVIISTELSVLQNPDLATDTIWSLMLKYNI